MSVPIAIQTREWQILTRRLLSADGADDLSFGGEAVGRFFGISSTIINPNLELAADIRFRSAPT